MTTTAAAPSHQTATAVRFITPLPGLGEHTEYDLTPVHGGLYKLTATNGIRLFVVDPALHAPDYAPAVPVADTERIGIDAHTEPVVLLIATATSEGVSLNTTAPILINPDTGAAIQSINS